MLQRFSIHEAGNMEIISQNALLSVSVIKSSVPGRLKLLRGLVPPMCICKARIDLGVKSFNLARFPPRIVSFSYLIQDALTPSLPFRSFYGCHLVMTSPR